MDSVEPLMEGVPLHDAVLCISSNLVVVGVADCYVREIALRIASRLKVVNSTPQSNGSLTRSTRAVVYHISEREEPMSM